MNILYKLLLLDGGESSDGNAPVNTVAPVISGTLVVGSVLTTTNGTWTSDTGIIPPYTYQWKRGVTNIGTDANTYTLVTADAGQNITCVVTACDSDGCTPATSNSVYIIDAEAQAHYDRVIADGGTIPLGLTALNEFIVSVKNNYSVASVNTAMWALKPHWGISGIKTASGTGATAGGRATSVLYDICGVNGDFIQTTASAQPLALVHSGTNYLWQSGVSGNSFTTPNAVANQLVGSVDIDASFEIGATNAFSCGKMASSGSLPNYGMYFSGTNLQYIDSAGNYTTIANISSFLPVNGSRFWIRIYHTGTTATAYTSLDGINWTSRGSNTVASLASSNTSTVIFSSGNMVSTPSKLYSMRIYNGDRSSGGTLVVSCDPASYSRATSQTSWVSATGETWTLNTASTNNALKACIVDQTMIMGNGTSYGMRAPSLNITDTAITSYTVFRKFTSTAWAQVVNELGANILSGQGKTLVVNDSANTESIGVRGNIGFNYSFYTSTSLSLKVATAVNNIANANESAPYLINNVSQTLSTNSPANNNTLPFNGTGYNFLARNNSASYWANVIATGDIVVKGEDDNTKRTAMYNLLKTLSNI